MNEKERRSADADIGRCVSINGHTGGNRNHFPFDFHCHCLVCVAITSIGCGVQKREDLPNPVDVYSFEHRFRLYRFKILLGFYGVVAAIAVYLYKVIGQCFGPCSQRGISAVNTHFPLRLYMVCKGKCRIWMLLSLQHIYLVISWAIM